VPRVPPEAAFVNVSVRSGLDHLGGGSERSNYSGGKPRGGGGKNRAGKGRVRTSAKLSKFSTKGSKKSMAYVPPFAPPIDVSHSQPWAGLSPTFTPAVPITYDHAPFRSLPPIGWHNVVGPGWGPNEP
jgi:hypothetical protein